MRLVCAALVAAREVPVSRFTRNEYNESRFGEGNDCKLTQELKSDCDLPFSQLFEQPRVVSVRCSTQRNTRTQFNDKLPSVGPFLILTQNFASSSLIRYHSRDTPCIDSRQSPTCRYTRPSPPRKYYLPDNPFLSRVAGSSGERGTGCSNE